MLLHPSHAASLRRVTLLILGLLLGLVVVWLLPPLTQLQGIAGYAPLHTLLETLAVAIAALIFAVGWNAPHRDTHGSLVIVVMACAFLGVGLLDLSHALSYQGMPDFVTPSGPEKAINFWLSARILAALALLAAALLPWRALSRPAIRFPLLVVVLGFVALAHWLFLYRTELVPRTFIAGQGLTAFKVSFEYVIIGINTITALALLLRMRKPRSFDVAALLGAVVAMGLSEFFFTLYASVTDLFNLMGHLYKVASYLFLYRALFVQTIEDPYHQLSEARALLKNVKDSIPDLLWLKDAEHRYVTCNPQFERLYGVKEAALIGKTDHDFVSAELADSFIRNDDEAATARQARTNEEWLTFADDGYRGLFETVKTPLFDHKGRLLGVLGIARDITRRNRAEEEAVRLANYDPLTLLPNRRLLMERLKQALSNSTRHRKHGALLFLDLDNFKQLNDTRGHDVGDQLLLQVGQRLNGCVRDSDTVARLGGDEFVVMIENLDPVDVTAARQAEEVGTKVLHVLRQPYVLAGKVYQSTPSIGISMFPGKAQTASDLIKEADMAMYQAKAGGRNMLCFFQQAMQEAILIRAALEADMRLSLNHGDFRLYFQPQVDTQGRVMGAEALIRWAHPERGLLAPGQFIPMAEQTGLIVRLGNWVLLAACRQLQVWASDPVLSALTLSINVSELQLRQDDFVESVREALQACGAPPSRLKLELTESQLVSNVDSVIAKMNLLRTLGVNFSLDDFGTGYSSLAYLKRMPLSQLKIDPSFVQDVLVDANDAAIAISIVALAHSLGLGVIAEGVETAEQREFLERNGCHNYQGYLFSRPVPLEAFEAYARSHA